jgi:hypothetical protein
MLIRKRIVRSFSEREHTYLELARTYRKDGKVCQECLSSLGRLDEFRESGNIDRMIPSLMKIA